MTAVDVRSSTGDHVGSVELAEGVFGLKPNVALMHQVVNAQLAAARAGGHSTLTRAEVRGGGAKPWRQKGTGRSRQGSTRAPHWRGGGVAMGPHPRSYRQRTPKKMVRIALYGALSDRAAGGRIVVVDQWSFDVPRTKDASAALSALGVTGKALVVVDAHDDATAKSFRNLPSVATTIPGELSAYDVLCADWVIFTKATLPSVPMAAEVPSVPEAADAKATSAEGQAS